MNTHRKGWSWRRKVELWLQEAGFRTVTRGVGYPGDDIYAEQPENCTGLGRPGLNLSIECKNTKAITLAAFVDQAARQVEEYPLGTIPVVVVHRAGRDSVDEGYVVMSGATFIELVTR